MKYFNIKRKGKCENTPELTDTCPKCKEKHTIAPAKYDSVDIKEAVRTIDYNRNLLIELVQKAAEKVKRDKKQKARLDNLLKRIYYEMNEAVREICAQNDLYQPYRKMCPKCEKPLHGR